MEQILEKDDWQFAVTSCDFVIGKTYPILAMITKITDSKPGQVTAELNNRIRANITLSDPQMIELLREKAFETAIFVSTVVALEPEPEVECIAVIFGKSPRYSA